MPLCNHLAGPQLDNSSRLSGNWMFAIPHSLGKYKHIDRTKILNVWECSPDDPGHTIWSESAQILSNQFCFFSLQIMRVFVLSKCVPYTNGLVNWPKWSLCVYLT